MSTERDSKITEEVRASSSSPTIHKSVKEVFDRKVTKHERSKAKGSTETMTRAIYTPKLFSARSALLIDAAKLMNCLRWAAVKSVTSTSAYEINILGRKVEYQRHQDGKVGLRSGEVKSRRKSSSTRLPGATHTEATKFREGGSGDDDRNWDLPCSRSVSVTSFTLSSRFFAALTFSK